MPPPPPKIEMHGVEVQLICEGVVPFVSMETSSPFHGCASTMLQTALDSFGKVDGLYHHSSDAFLQKELTRSLHLRSADYMLAQVKDFPTVRAVGATKRSLLLALVLGLALTGTVKVKKLWTALSEFDAEVAKKFDELLSACWDPPASGDQGKDNQNWWYPNPKTNARGGGGGCGWNTGGGYGDDETWGAWKDRSRSPWAARQGAATKAEPAKEEARAANPANQGKPKAAEERAVKKAKMTMEKDRDNKINNFKEAVIDNTSCIADPVNQHDDRGDGWIGRGGVAETEVVEGRDSNSGKPCGKPLIGCSTDPERTFMRFAGQPKPEDVRPLPVLKEAFKKAQERWKSHRDWYHVSDMMRSISQDLRVQHLHNAFAVEAHQYWAQIALDYGDFRAFHTATQELEAYYEDPDLERGAAKLKEILAWYVLYMSVEGEGVATTRFLQKHAKRLGVGSKKAPVVELALSLRRNMAQQRFLRVVTELSSQPDAPMDAAEPALIPKSLKVALLRKAKLESLIELCKAFDKMKDLTRNRLESVGLLSKEEAGDEDLPLVYQDKEQDLIDTHTTAEEAKKALEVHDQRQVHPTGVRIVRRMGRPLNDHLNTFVRQSCGGFAGGKPPPKKPPRLVD